MHTSPISPLWLDSQHFPCCTPPFTLACFAFFWLTVDFDLLCNASIYSVHPRFLIIVIHSQGIVNGWHRCWAHFTQNTQNRIIFYKYTCFRYHSYTVSLSLSLFQVVLHTNCSHVYRHTRFCSRIYYFTRLVSFFLFMNDALLFFQKTFFFSLFYPSYMSLFTGDATSSPYLHCCSQLSPLHFFLFPPMMHWCKMIDSVVSTHCYMTNDLFLFLPFIRILHLLCFHRFTYLLFCFAGDMASITSGWITRAMQVIALLIK